MTRPVKKDRINVYFDPALTPPLEALAARRDVSKSAIIEAALASFLSPDAADQREAALIRRLDRMASSIERLERDQTTTGEALALFIQFWLTSTPPAPDAGSKAATTKGRERYQAFMETLGRRLAKGGTLAKEISRQV